MCGIVAYSGNRKAVLNTLITGLTRMEYRGYDSAGVAIVAKDKVYVKKTVGKIVKLEEAVAAHPPDESGSVGIAHTRWATHGLVTEENAHPHSSADKKIWVVHNGIIENYKQIKANLTKKGISFESETDSEVVAKLIGSLYKGDLKKAVLEAVSKLTGAFSLCVISENEPDRLIGVKLASPLLVGVGEDEVILASDVSAVIERTKRVVYLEDGEMIDIKSGKYEVVNFENELKDKEINQVEWDVEKATKGGYEHYLLKEIMEQPAVITDSIRGRILSDSASLKFGGLIDVKDRLRDIDHVVLLGVGTSYYSARLGELFFNTLSGIRATTAMSPEFRYNKNIIDKKTWVIAVSQSGETADTIAAINEAKRHGALVTGVVNVVGSTIARITDAGIYNHIGPEISVASTKAFTSQSLILLMQAILLGRQNDLDFAEAAETLAAIKELPDIIQKVLDEREKIEKIAHQIYKAENLLYIGRRFNYPIALEGALKIKEIAYIHAEGLSAGELKHGFIALVDKNLPTIAIATDDSVKDKMLANIAEVKARNGKVIALVNSPLDNADEQIIVPSSNSEFLQPLVNNVALQLLAYYVASLKKLDIDQPRNLAKSVTVE